MVSAYRIASRRWGIFRCWVFCWRRFRGREEPSRDRWCNAAPNMCTQLNSQGLSLSLTRQTKFTTRQSGN